MPCFLVASIKSSAVSLAVTLNPKLSMYFAFAPSADPISKTLAFLGNLEKLILLILLMPHVSFVL